MSDKKIKVAQLTTVHQRYDQRVLFKTSKSLAESGFDVTLLVSDDLDDEVCAGVKIQNIGNIQGNRINRMLVRSFVMYKKALKLRADIYHFHDPELMPIGILLKLAGKKVIYDVHEDVPRQVLRKKWIPKVFRKTVSLLVRLIENITTRIIDAVVTVTPNIAERFAHTKVIETRNYVRLDEFSITPEIAAEKSKITYIGGITEDRGIKQMVGALADQKAQLTLAGKFQERGLEEHCQKMQGWQQVDFIGWQDRKSIATLLDETLVGLVLLQPTGDYEDAYPVKLFEYMAAGASVVASNFPLWQNIVDEAQCGLCVDPTDEKSIAEAINYLIDNPEIAVTMGKMGREAVINKFSWESEFQKLVLLYRELLQQK